jgi:LysM repeat protein
MKNRLLVVAIIAALLLAGLSFPSTTEAGAAGFCHVVKPGENVSSIAARYGVTVNAIVQANNLWNPNVIYVGQCLVIPGGGSGGGTTPPSGCTVKHTVKRGEYLKQISAWYGANWRTVAQINGLANPNLIYPGQKLIIPVKCKPKPTPTPKPSKPAKPSAKKPWTGKYWNNRYLSGSPKYTRYYSKISFDWRTKGPGKPIGGQNFSARYTRSKKFDGGLYRFNVLVDDGVRVWLDGVLLIDQWHDSGLVHYSADRQVSAGTHHIKIDYYQNKGGAQLVFWVEGIGSPGAAWKCDFYNNTSLSGNPVATQYYSSLDFDWGLYAPASGVTADYFSARCEGDFWFAGGTFTFTAATDDGIRAWVDNQLILDEWRIQATSYYGVDVGVGEGNHRLKVEYFEHTGKAVLKFRWQGK